MTATQERRAWLDSLKAGDEVAVWADLHLHSIDRIDSISRRKIRLELCFSEFSATTGGELRAGTDSRWEIMPVRPHDRSIIVHRSACDRLGEWMRGQEVRRLDRSEIAKLLETIWLRRNDTSLIVQVAELIDRVDRERKAMEAAT